MLVIGELLNASIKSVREAVLNRDQDFVKDLAVKQVAQGAHYLDVNAATGKEAVQEAGDMEWLVQTIQAVVDVPLAIDTTDRAVLEAGLKVHRGRALLNSVSAEVGRLEPFLELAAAYRCPVIALPIREGIPESAAGRLKVCSEILERSVAFGLSRDEIYFDALVLPLSVGHTNPSVALETIRAVKQMDGRTVVGLSNVSYGLPRRDLLNRSFVLLALQAGLDAAILNPLDGELMATVLAGQALLGRDEMCMVYLRAYRKGKLDK
ncbi:MAG: dihydropteroate synthase [Candidatus Desulforudis sp.]|nr:dihydropteroate synthase [Desulforudis sp.]